VVKLYVQTTVRLLNYDLSLKWYDIADRNPCPTFLTHHVDRREQDNNNREKRET